MHRIGDTRALAIGEVTRTDFVKFAGAGGDFNPMHHDDTFARNAGFPSVFAMGMMTASIASRFLTDWFDLTAVRTFDVRFKAMVWPNESLAARGKIADRIEREDETRLVVDFDVINEAEEVKITCRAEVAESEETR